VPVNTVEDVLPADDTPRLASNFPHVADIVYHFLQDAMGGGFQGSVALVTRKSLCSGGTVGRGNVEAGVEGSKVRLSTTCHFIFRLAAVE